MIQNPARSPHTPSSLAGLTSAAVLLISIIGMAFFDYPWLVFLAIAILFFLAWVNDAAVQRSLTIRKPTKKRNGRNKLSPAPEPNFGKISGKPRKYDRDGIIVCIRCENSDLLGMTMSSQEVLAMEQQISKYLGSWSTLQGGTCSPIRRGEWLVCLPVRDQRPAQPSTNERLLALHHELESLRLPGILPKQSLRFSLGASQGNGKANYQQNLGNAQAALELARRKQLPLYMADRQIPIPHADRQELVGRGLEVHFQPVCHASGYALAWYEALLRAKPGQPQNESPSALLMEAEMTGGIPQITTMVIRESLDFYDRMGLPVAINLSVADLVDPEIQDLIINAASCRTPGALVLEVIEQVNLFRIHEYGGFLARARAAGCRIALDDFGTGYANLQTLLTVAIDIVKLDGSLIAQSMEDKPVNDLLCSLVAYCRQRGISVVAEHIETAEQARHFQAMGCEFLQGYFLGKPDAACYV